MNKRLLYSLLVAALAVAGFFAAGISTANADLRSITVKLANGDIIEVVREVTKGTPLEKLLPPGSTPIDDAPADGGSDGGDSGSTGGDDSFLPDPIVEKNGGGTDESGQGQGDDKSKDKKDDESDQVDPQSLVDPLVTPEKAKPEPEEPDLSPTFRHPDGRPSRDNPSLTDAPGPGNALGSGNAIDGLPTPTTARAVPNFVINKFQVPIFLLPIYQAAGSQYGVRWEILAAINEIETDYGRNLSTSSAGAVGWMQFIPSSWKMYGVDANDDGKKDPYNPVDAIFAAARYLKAAGYDDDVRQSIFSYNHADWYVDSVMMRAKLIAGTPSDLTGSLTGLTEGRFPVYAKSQYADDLSEAEATHKLKPGENAANVQTSDPDRRQIQIFAKEGAPVVAVNDGQIVDIGNSGKLGKYVVLQDAYGNQYTYSGLGEVSKFFPAPEDQATPGKDDLQPLPAHDPEPDQAATKGGPESKAADVTKDEDVAKEEPRTQQERLFANPSRPESRKNGGVEQIVNAGGVNSYEGFSRYHDFVESGFGLKGKNTQLDKLEKGSKVSGGTLLGNLGTPTKGKAPHMNFEIRPAGRGAPRIDPKPILDGWKLLEQTSIYRANGQNVLQGGTGVGQVLLMSKPLLEKRVLNDKRIDIYPCGRQDIQTGQIDRRVLAVLEYLAESGLRPDVTALKCGHSKMTTSGNVSNHFYGGAADIAAINGIPIMGHQEKGGIADQAVQRILQLQGTMRPDEVISLLDYGGPSFALPDHADHIHVGFSPTYGFTSKLSDKALAVLKPDQWSSLVDRLGDIPQPKIKQGKGNIVLPAKRGSDAHAGD